jgi:phage tail-like protein
MEERKMAVVDPYKNYRFHVELGGISQGGFAECSGLSAIVNIIEYREGGDDHVRKLPGQANFGNITLKRGVTISRELQDWITNIINGQPDRRNGSIILQDDAGIEVVRWNFTHAFPHKWVGPSLNAKGNEVAMESLELCCERVERG